MVASLFAPGNTRKGVALAFFLLALAYALLFPIVDWDALPYLYLAYTWLGQGVGAAHAAAYAALGSLPGSTQTLLQQGDVFRTAATHTPAVLQQVSAFYADRIGYLAAVSALLALKVPPLVALQALNAVGQGLVAGAFALRVRFQNWFYVYGFLIFLFFPSVLKIARWTNPDGLVAGLFLMGLALVWPGATCPRQTPRTVAVAGGLLLAAVLCRPNMVCLLAPLAVGFAVLRAYPVAIWLAVCCGVGLGVHALWPGYGLPVLWAHTFNGTFTNPASVHIPFQLNSYLALLSLRTLGLHGRDLLLVLTLLLSLGGLWLRGAHAARVLGTALAAGCLLQFLLFPAFWERLYIAPICLLAATAIAGFWAPQKREGAR